MLRLQTMRTAMVALTAIGMICTTTAHAAGYESSATPVYGGNPLDPGHPTVPSAPSGPVQVATDVKVTSLYKNSNNGTITWKFRVQNISKLTAKDVEIRRGIIRWDQQAPTSEIDFTYDPWITMAPGEYKDIEFSCAPKAGHQPCYMAVGAAYVYGTPDRDQSNNGVQQ